jgi:hypothetical protein
MQPDIVIFCDLEHCHEGQEGDDVLSTFQDVVESVLAVCLL